MKQKVTMQDIADHFGISKVTVSKALNNKEGVSDELKEKIIKAASDLGYRLNTIAKSLKEQKTFNIGVLIPEQFTNTGKFHRENENAAFYMDFYQVIARELNGAKYAPILYILSPDEENAGILPRLYQEDKVDGFIILGQVNHEYVEKLLATHMPIVFLDFYDEYLEMDSIISDNYTGSYLMTNYLIKTGHKKIGFIGDIYATSSIQDRYLGYYKSLLEHGIELDMDYVLSDRNQEGIHTDIIYPKVLPDAFVVNCDQIANRVIRELQDRGYKIPQDISITGFDNSIYSSVSRPEITTVEIDIVAMAKAGVDLILRKIDNPEYRSGKISLSGKIIYKDSVKTY